MRAEASENTKMSLVSKDIELSSLPADLSHERPNMQPPVEQHCDDSDREAEETDPVDDRDMYYRMRAAMMSR